MSELPENEDAALARYSDPGVLARIGADTCRHLDSLPQVQRVDTADADVYLVPRFLSRRDAQDIARVINTRAAPSTLLGTNREGYRTSWTHYFARNDPLTEDVEDYISDVLGIANVHSETMQGQRYQVGQEYKAHYDWFPMSESYWQTEALRGGQRTWTAMVYLNEPKAGGGTQFPMLDVTFQPQAGTMVLWNNMDREGRPNRKTIHAALPVEKGIKHVITKWYRQEPWRLLNP